MLVFQNYFFLTEERFKPDNSAELNITQKDIKTGKSVKYFHFKPPYYITFNNSAIKRILKGHCFNSYRRLIQVIRVKILYNQPQCRFDVTY
ncbi:MAG TPA: hypothetical protein DCL86_13375 [Bacteroidales bacterium]|jgi:hypothetical protein|nr:hypothetical protein [Bacteroidales bacterium]